MIFKNFFYSFFSKILIFYRNFLDIFSDKKCLFCNNIEDISLINNCYICKDCYTEILNFHNINCDFCYHPLYEKELALDNKKSSCENCSNLLENGEANFIKNISILPLYNKNKENIIIAKYYKDNIIVKKYLSFSSYIIEKINYKINFDQFLNKINFIIPVPISLRKKILRNYSISSYFSKFISKKFKKKIIHLFIEKGLKYTHLNKENRFEIEDKRYFINKKLLKKVIKNMNIINAIKKENNDKNFNKINLNILIIDDIFTTGSTINHLSKLLKNFFYDELFKYLNKGKNQTLNNYFDINIDLENIKNIININIFSLTLFRKIKNK